MTTTEKPIYSQQTTPEGAPLVGTLYLDPTTGWVYRLRGYYPDWAKMSQRTGGQPSLPTVASYSALTPSGSQTSVEHGEMPEAALANPIWTPTEPEIVLTWTGADGQLATATQPEREGYKLFESLTRLGATDVRILWAAA